MSTTFAFSYKLLYTALIQYITYITSHQQYQMSSSPFLHEDVRRYMKQHEVQQLVNTLTNGLLRQLPPDPYGFLISELQARASQDITILNVHPFQTLTDGFPAIKLRMTVSFMNKSLTLTLNPLGIVSEQSTVYDEDRPKGMRKGIAYMQEHIVHLVKDRKCSEQSAIDALLESENGKDSTVYQVYVVSYALPMVQSHVLYRPLYQVYSQMYGKGVALPRVYLNILQGGKAVSKCKVYKYYVVCKQGTEIGVMLQVGAAVRKAITSGKGGQAALKITSDGSYLCPLDTILDNLKIVEDAIISCNAKETCSVGLSWAADTLFSPDTKKYELENPKTPFDNDQMVDYMVKLVQDRPIITYLEDPIASGQRAAWGKLIAKIKENEGLRHVKVGSRNCKLLNVLQEVDKQVQELCVMETVDTHPDKTEEGRKAANANKVNIDCFMIRMHEFKTVSALVRARKALAKITLILQDDNFQTSDTSIVDICCGLEAGLTLGNLAKFDRISKLNRIGQIKEQIEK